jgi:hypothetical protein
MIALLDLNYTLVANSEQLRQKPLIIRKATERYRSWLVDLLKTMQAKVILVTIRHQQDKDWTLARIASELDGWQPDDAFFNDRSSKLSPPEWKRIAMTELIFPKYGDDPKQYLSVESNLDTHKMYATLGIRGFKVFDCKEEPSVAGSRNDGGQIALFN